MPVTKSAAKALRGSRQKKEVNNLVRTKLRQAVKKATKKPTAKNLSEASQTIDRASKKRIIHSNKANRLKSQLAKSLKK
ncbi:30S ribosomal protein S20 [Patescibacteria group bacterium]|nr:30S ribosomal protein S20 [Patescibacteria group bacterium]